MASNSALNSTLGLLSHLSIDELKEVFLNDNAKFDAITKDAHKFAEDMNNSEREMLIASNKSLAEYNLSRSDTFQELKMQLSDLYKQLQEINKRVESKANKLKELTSTSNSEVVLALLQTATSELEQKTDEISENFLNGDIKLETYLEQYPSQRKAMHLRKAKVEKMSDLITRRLSYKSVQPSPPRSITTITQTNVRSVYPPNYSNAPVTVPYPIEPINMPMPNSFMQNHF